MSRGIHFEGGAHVPLYVIYASCMINGLHIVHLLSEWLPEMLGPQSPMCLSDKLLDDRGPHDRDSTVFFLPLNLSTKRAKSWAMYYIDLFRFEALGRYLGELENYAVALFFCGYPENPPKGPS